jgi:hypothetical protein
MRIQSLVNTLHIECDHSNQNAVYIYICVCVCVNKNEVLKAHKRVVTCLLSASHNKPKYERAYVRESTTV